MLEGVPQYLQWTCGAHSGAGFSDTREQFSGALLQEKAPFIILVRIAFTLPYQMSLTGSIRVFRRL
jgi:hypothetical protein